MENSLSNIGSYNKKSGSPELIASLINNNRHNLFINDTDKYIIKKHYSDHILEYDDIHYKMDQLKQRFYYNVPSFPSWGSSDNRREINIKFSYFRDALKNNVIEFLSPNIPLLSIEDSFLNNVVLHELLNNAIQSSYAIEKRLDMENGNNYSERYYGEKDYCGLIEVAFNKWKDCSDDLQYDTIKIRNYAPYSKFHVQRILERIEAETTSDNFFKFCEKSIGTDVYTGLSNIGLLMIKKVINKHMSKLCNRDFFFSFEYVHIHNFQDVGAYEFTLIFPDHINTNFDFLKA